MSRRAKPIPRSMLSISGLKSTPTRRDAMQTLEQQLEEMRATYLLNTEKLEYNYRVLTERDMENNATLSHQKRKLTKLKDALSGVVQVGVGAGDVFFSSQRWQAPR